MTKQPKIAIFYDWLNQWGGAEKVLLDIIKLYPDAPIYTLVYDPLKTPWFPKNKKIITSWLNKFPFSKRNTIFYTPFYSFALESFDFSQYDIILSTTSVLGHCFITPASSLYICYMHNPNRYLYQTPKQFKFLTPLLNKYQKTDYFYAQRPDYFFCNSKTVQQRIKKNYNRDSEIIYPGIDTDFFRPTKQNNSKEYFLIVSRLVSHKKINIAIQACQKLNKSLKIVGEGRDKNKLFKLASHYSNHKIEFLGKVNQNKLLNLYQNCSALICPQEEDFGLTPLEANACGKPVIAFQKGGITETIINQKTGLFFKDQTVESLVEIIDQFDSKKFKQNDCIQNAKKYSRNNFMLHLNQSITDLWQHKQKNIS